MRINIKNMSIILILLLMIVSIPSVFAENSNTYDYYVSTDGSSSGIGTKENPFNTIQKAVDKGGSIFINNGTYNVYDDSGYEISKSVKIVGEDRDKVIIDAGKNGRIFAIDSNIEVTFINITFKNGNNENDYIYDSGRAIYVGEGNITIENCYFVDNNAVDGFGTYGGAIYHDNDYLISDTYSSLNATDYEVNIANGETIIGTSNPLNVIYVATNGNDNTGDGSESNPYASIQKAIAQNLALGGNYSIIVKEGQYNISSDISITANVTIIGQGNVILYGNGSSNRAFYISGSDVKYTKFENLNFLNFRLTSGANGIVIAMSSISGGSGNAGRYLVISNCTFENNNGTGSLIISYGETTITDCIFINNTLRGSTAGFSGIINIQAVAGTSSSVSYCNFINNTATNANGINGIYSNSPVNADYNFWGTNDKPSSKTISGSVTINYWVILDISPNSTENIKPGDKINFTIDFTKYTNGANNYTLTKTMPKITITPTTLLGSFDEDPITINTNGSIIYTAVNIGSETINFNIPSNITQFDLTVGSQYSGIVYVSKTGNDNNEGSEDHPVLTLSKAIEIATATGGSKKIIILGGTYNENKLNIDSDLEIIANGTVIINGNNYEEIFNIASGNVTLYGLTLNVNSTNGVIVNRGGKLYITYSTFNNENIQKLAINNSGNLDISYSILNNTIITNNGAGNVSANYNWWGTNNKPTCVAVENWVIMTIDVNKVYTGETTNITIKLNTVTDGTIYSTLLNPLPINYVVLNVTSGSGTLNRTNILLENGIAYVSFNGGLYNSGEISGLIQATIDSQTLDIIVEKSSYYWFINETGYRTLQQAIVAAGYNDVIKGLGGVYIVEERIDIGHRYMPIEPWEIYKTITITSLDENNPVILSGNNSSRLFFIDAGSSLTLINVVVANFNGATSYDGGYAGAIYVMNSGYDIANLTVLNCTFENNTAGSAGAIESWGNLIIKDSIFRNNTATETYAGAILSAGNLIIDNTLFESNYAETYAGALYLYTSMDYMIITNSIFIDNEAHRGGAIFTNGQPISIENCSFDNNRAVNHGYDVTSIGGAIYVSYYGVVIKNSNFTNNYAEDNGGAIELSNAYHTVWTSTTQEYTYYYEWTKIDNCRFINNTAGKDGGAIYSGSNYISYAKINNSFFENNKAGNNGGAISNNYGHLLLNNTIFKNNSAGANGGAISNFGDWGFPDDFWGNITIDNCEFSENSGVLGGSIYNPNQYTKITLTNSKFNNEKATSTGGVIYNNGTLILNNNTMNNCSAENEGNYIYNNGTIDSVVLTYLGNRTVEIGKGSSIRLNVTITDDMGNPITGGNVTLVFDNKTMSFYVVEGLATYTVTFDEFGTYLISGSYSTFKSGNVFIVNSGEVAVVKKDTNIKADNVNSIVGETSKLTINLIDNEGNPLANQNISFYVDGKLIGNNMTDINGLAVFYHKSNNIGTFKWYALFDGDEIHTSSESNMATLTINKIATKITMSNAKLSSNNRVELSVQLKDVNGKLLANKKVSITINKKTYTVTTDSNGIAKFIINGLKGGNYTVKTSFAGDSTYYASTISKVQVVKSVVDLTIAKVKKVKYIKNKKLAVYKVTIQNKGNTKSKATILRHWHVRNGYKTKIMSVKVKSIAAGGKLTFILKYYPDKHSHKYCGKKYFVLNPKKTVKETSYKNNKLVLS